MTATSTDPRLATRPHPLTTAKQPTAFQLTTPVHPQDSGKNLSFTGEWFSGQHNLSGLIPGFTYHRDSLIVVGGDKIPNNFRREDSGLALEVGFFFGGKQATNHEMNEFHYGVRTP